MEIYKLKDNIPAAHGKNQPRRPLKPESGLASHSSELKITDIKQAVHSDNRVNVYINGKYEFSLDIAQVVDLNVKIDKVISEAELEDLKRASEYGKVYQRALEWALMRPRSVRELRDYLKRRERTAVLKSQKREWEAAKSGKNHCATVPTYNFDDLIVERLCSRGYVDDAKFATYYVENRFTKKGISAKRLKMELMSKGISPELIEATLSATPRDDTTEIRKIIAKKRTKYDDTKLIQYLCRQGFDYELSRELVARSSETD